MTQTKRMSFIESCTQTIVAFSLSVVLQPYIYAWYGWEIDYNVSAQLAGVYTLISLVRSYIVRRGFNYVC